MWNINSLALLQSTASESGYQGPDFMPLVKISVILILAIGGLAWGFRRFIAGNLKTRAGKRSLQVLDVLPLGGKQRLAVVRCYDRTFAIGLGDKEVTAIAELDPVIGADETPSDAMPDDEQTFQRALAHVQKALEKTRQGVGPRPLHAEAKRKATVAELLTQVDTQHTRRAAAAAAAQPAPVPQSPAPVARKAKPRKARAAATSVEAGSTTPVAEPTATPQVRRKAQSAAMPAPVAGLQSLGLEGVMG